MLQLYLISDSISNTLFRYEVVRSRMSDFVNLLVSKEGPPDLHATEIIILFVHCLEVSH